MKKLLFILVYFSAFLASGQKKLYSKYFKEGNSFLVSENYVSALGSFLKAYEIDSSNANINFKIGFCYSEIPGRKHWGEKYLLKAVNDVSKKYKEDNPLFKHAPYYAYFYYAELLHTLNRLDESKKMFKQYESFFSNKKTGEEFELLSHFEKMVEYAEEKEALPVKINIKNLGDSVNSQFSEYSPICDGNEKTLIFTYKGEHSYGAEEGLRTESGKFFEDVFVSTKLENGEWSKAKSIGLNINSKGHDASVSLSNDGNTLIVYRDDDGDGNLYFSTKIGNEWGELKKFNKEINSKFWEPSACISADNELLFFISDRPGGYGGRDIYKCRKLPNGEWSKPVNLGPSINTKYDEESPFLHSNGKDFYFSSNGHKSMGGFDIMVAEMNDKEEFGEIFSLPYPINTTEDDLFYFVSNDGKRGYYSSSHEDSLAKGESDIYVVSLEELNRKDRIYARGGFVINNENKDSLKIIVKSGGKIFGQYKPNSKGEFIALMSMDSTYEIEYFQNNEMIKRQSVNFDSTKNFRRFGQETQLEKVELIKKTSTDTSSKFFENVFKFNLSVIYENGKPAGFSTVLIQDSMETKKYSCDSSGKINDINLFLNRTYKITANNGEASGTLLLSTNKITRSFNEILKLSAGKIVSNDSREKINKDFSELKGKSLSLKANYLRLLELIREIKPGNITYKVQIAAYRKPENYKWKHLSEFGTPEQNKLEDGITRFTMGAFEKLDDCNVLLSKIISKGQRDAWITAVYKGKRYTLEQLVSEDFYIKAEF